MAAPRPYVSGNFQLVFDGADVGIIAKLGGGSVSAEVAKIPRSTEYLIKNQLGNIKYEPFSLQCGLSMGQAFKDWIIASLNSTHSYKSGEVVVSDYDLKAIQSTEFKNALVTEVGFPAADAAAKDVALLSVKFEAETTRRKAGDGARISKPTSTNQTMFHPSNFRLTIDGLEATTGKASKVEALTIKQKVTRDNIGNARDYEIIPAGLEVPNLKFTFNRNAVEAIEKWHLDFVIEGKNDVTQEKTGLLEFLDPTRQKVLLAIEFKGLGIFDLKGDEYSNNADKVSTCTAEMYCDEMTIKEWLA